MQDRESQSDVNPGIVEQEMDEAPVEREGMQGSGDVEREDTQGGDEGRGGPVTERERPDGEAFDGLGQTAP
jgi:hypothetical protein